MTNIVGFVGRAGSGKSTAAAHVLARCGGARFSLAEPLKLMARDVLGFSHEQLYGTQAQKEAVDPRYGFSPRWFLQRLGTEGCRKHLGPDVWVHALMRAIGLWRSCGASGVAVVDDVRFPNEADAIRAAGGFVVRLVCPDAPPTPGAEHASEALVDDVPSDWTIVSPRTPDSADLKSRIDAFLVHEGLMP